MNFWGLWQTTVCAPLFVWSLAVYYHLFKTGCVQQMLAGTSPENPNLSTRRCWRATGIGFGMNTGSSFMSQEFMRPNGTAIKEYCYDMFGRVSSVWETARDTWINSEL